MTPSAARKLAKYINDRSSTLTATPTPKSGTWSVRVDGEGYSKTFASTAEWEAEVATWGVVHVTKGSN